MNASIFSYTNWMPQPKDSITLVSLPLFHVTALQNGMNVPIFTGSTMVIMTRWDSSVAAQLIEGYRVTHWRFITAMAIDFFSNPKLASFNLTSLTSIGGGGAQMPRTLATKIKKTTGLDYIEGYGLTETMAGVIINPPERPKPQCLGIPVFDVDCRVIDPEKGTIKRAKETGEIVLNAPQLFQRYWNNPLATEAAFVKIKGKNFFRTGDLGHFDDEGYIYFTDRLKRMINASGYKVWPAEVEGVMLAHLDIREICVISSPHSKRGETVKAVIIPSGTKPPNPADISEWCRERMAAYKVPKIFTFTDELPRSSSGKVLWRVLQDRENKKIRNSVG